MYSCFEIGTICLKNSHLVFFFFLFAFTAIDILQFTLMIFFG